MPIITEAGKLPWEEKPTPREGRIQRKPLATGTANAPDNFEFNLYRFYAGYSTPRHRHTFEQMRFALTGAITYDPRKPIPPGSLVYFPEGAYYGPQDTPVDSEILLLQYGGASGQGYVGQEQLIAARAELSKSGEFHDGVYTYYTKDGTKRNKEAVEMISEHVLGHPVEYAKPRITEAVRMDTEAYTWIPQGDSGIDEKLLAVFTERKVSARMFRATRDTKMELESSGRQLLFTLDGDLQISSRTCGPHTSVFSDRGESLSLNLKAGCEGLMFTLPQWATVSKSAKQPSEAFASA